MSEPEPPVGVLIEYRDGSSVEPESVDYLGVDPTNDQHVWMARLPRPLQPGLAIVRVAALPARTTVIAG